MRHRFIQQFWNIEFKCLALLLIISTAHVHADTCSSLMNDSVPAIVSDSIEVVMNDSVTVTLTDSVPAVLSETTQTSAIVGDTVQPQKKLFDFKQLILPGALIAVGSFGVCNGAFHELNNSVRDGMADLRGDHYFRADDYIQYLPVAAYLGLGAVGVKCKNSFKERFAAGTTAYLAMGILVNGIKYTVREKRPDSEARNSFPSGHTATVFMGAELIRQEYGLGLSIGAYAVATGVAFLRLYNDRHWLNDVIAGAGIGILSARIGYWMLPLYRKWFHWDKRRMVAMMPSYNYADKSVGIGLVACF